MFQNNRKEKKKKQKWIYYIFGIIHTYMNNIYDEKFTLFL